MKRTAIALSLLLLGCSTPVEDYPPPMPERTAAEQAGYTAYGGSGYLTDDKWLTLQWLAWPQKRSDIIVVLGYPNRVTPEGDIYIKPDGRELTIFYSGDQATGYQ